MKREDEQFEISLLYTQRFGNGEENLFCIIIISRGQSERKGERGQARSNAWIINCYAALFYILRLAIAVRAEALVCFRTKNPQKKSHREKSSFAISIKCLFFLYALLLSATKLKRYWKNSIFLRFLRVKTFRIEKKKRSKYLYFLHATASYDMNDKTSIFLCCFSCHSPEKYIHTNI